MCFVKMNYEKKSGYLFSYGYFALLCRSFDVLYFNVSNILKYIEIYFISVFQYIY